LFEMFENDEDYDLYGEASNGQEAIDLAIKRRPDLIILDMSMPILNGLEAARQLKKIMPNVPIILFTQHSDCFFGSALPFDLIVSKMDADQLMGHVRTLIPV
jgi:DNA-binding NarL/FixJ family response regulator